ncbi:SDR family NAD(P)-dependent oxidoreductase [Rhodopila sp.]|uniref:SDR family NAD(P)-dependent oxidoreductase n=1 Tax=Rhodopila sp. TaxID=2480087 RepID=UPI003D0C5FBE
MMSVTQPVLLLTGASRGIGHATVKRFGSAGWRVLTISRQAFDPRCPWPGGERNHIQLDLSDVDIVRDALPRIKEITGGRLDALINNAAVSPKHEDGGKITSLEMVYKDWLRVFNVNFFSAILLAQGLSELLVESRGSIVNMTSIVGSRVHPFASAAYATSKAALAALTREMANDLGRYGVRVNAVSPGEIDTAILSPGTEEIVQRDIPMRRVGKPNEVANLLFFLCSDQALYLSGSEVHIDGGQRV